MEPTLVKRMKNGAWRCDIYDRHDVTPRYDVQVWHRIPDLGSVHAGYGRYCDTLIEAVAYAAGVLDAA